MVLVLVLGTLLLLWPAMLNGGPMIFPDTTSYVRSADAAVAKFLGTTTEWTRPGEIERLSAGGTAAPAPSATAAPAAVPSADALRVPLRGRSPYYGALAYLGWLSSQFWLLAALQAFLASLAMTLFVRRTAVSKTGRAAPVALVIAAVALTTPVAWFASFVMPDLFAGLLILALSMLLLRWDRLKRGEVLFWLCLVAAAASFHSANVLIGVGMLILAAAAGWLKVWSVSSRGLAFGVAAIALGLAGEALYSWSVRQATGQAPVRPPFIMARMIADGPGYEYLRDTCPANGLMICDYLDRMPQPSDTFLWSDNPKDGVFSTLPPAEKRRLEAEQTRFILQVVLDRPVDQLSASLLAALRQAGKVGISEFNYDLATRKHFETRLPPAELERTQRTLAWQNRMPIEAMEGIIKATLVLSLLVLAWIAVRRGEQRPLIALLLAGIVLNILVCGTLSTPHQRYQARVLWLLPLAAGALAYQQSRRPGRTLLRGQASAG